MVNLATRAGWLALLLVHIPILLRLLSAGVDDAAAGSLIGLGAASVLFLLKTIDVPWLRLGSRRGTLLAFVLIAAVAHHEVLPAANEPLVIVVSSAAAAAGVIAANERWPLAGAFMLPRPALPMGCVGHLEAERESGRTPRAGHASASRGPPASRAGG